MGEIPDMGFEVSRSIPPSLSLSLSLSSISLSLTLFLSFPLLLFSLLFHSYVQRVFTHSWVFIGKAKPCMFFLVDEVAERPCLSLSLSLSLYIYHSRIHSGN